MRVDACREVGVNGGCSDGGEWSDVMSLRLDSVLRLLSCA